MDSTGKRATQLTVARYVVFLVLFCLYVRYRVTPAVDYEAHPDFPVFYSNVSFLQEFLSYPGGLARYLAGFAGLAYHSPWGGPLVLTAMVGLICWATDVLILALGGRFRGLAFGPGIILLAALNHLLDEPTAIVALLAALLSIALYLGLANGGDGRRVAVCLVVGVVLHYVAGGAFLLYALVVGLYELLGKRRRLPGLVSLLCMEAIPYLGATYVYHGLLLDTLDQWLPWDVEPGPWRLVAMCYLYYPPLVIGLAAWQWLAARRAAAAPGKPKGRRRKPGAEGTRGEAAAPGGPVRAPIGFLVGSAAVLAIGAAVAAYSYDPHAHRVLVVDDCARRGDWEGVLREARRLPLLYYTDVVNQDVNQALYETGRLGDAMFTYPQFRDWLIIDLDLGDTPEVQAARMQRRAGLWFQIGDLDLRLGLVNEAEHEAHEALAIAPHPEIVKRLALVNLVKRQPDAARVFLNALRDHPIYARQADDLLTRMASDPDVSDDPYIQRVRAVQLAHEDELRASPLPVRCRDLLEDRPLNRMAFEYLMASCLLRKDLDGFAQELPRLRALGYAQLPRHYQEAVLVRERMTMQPSDRGGYAISPEVLQSFADFVHASRVSGGDPTALAAQFGGTYFYYDAYGITGSMVEQ